VQANGQAIDEMQSAAFGDDFGMLLMMKLDNTD
jgi:hypothetical protein